MAPTHKRKPVDEEFITTLSDNDEGPLEEEMMPNPPPKKKAKLAKKSEKSKSSGKDDASESEPDEPHGIWGRNEDDDGAMDSDFEFLDDDAGQFADEEFEGWGFEGAKKGVTSGKEMVDIDEIIRRRREKKSGASNGKEQESDQDSDVENNRKLGLDDEADEVLADDAFGMNADSEEEGDEEEKDATALHDTDDSADDARGDKDDDDEPASDNDSVATPVGHPDDDASNASDGEDDAEEQAKRDAFFAPEEKTEKSGKAADASSFQGMQLSRPILRGLAAVGFTKPTPIQSKTIPIALMGKDLVGGAVTGSGKTAAFLVPILERLLFRPNKIPTTRVVVLTPTRELAMQCDAVGKKLARYTDIKFTLAVGGLSLKAQELELRLRPDVIIATPGRFIDHMRNSASFNVDTVEILILDEADRMLEDGFADELNEILTTLPKSRQTMLFSATMTSTVDRLIRVGLNKPVRLMVDSQKKTVTTLVQEFVRLRPGREDKRMGYLAHICKNFYHERVIVFFRQKKEAHKARIVFGLLGLSCAELHGSMSQTGRIASVESFRDGKVSYLLATDLASRGLDIKGVDTVINYEAPQSLEIYVHRVGRTARAGRRGTAVTLAAETDRKVVKAAVKAGKAQGAKIVSRVIPPAEADKLQEDIDAMEDEIIDIMQEEKEEKQLAQAEMQVKKGENLIEHEAEIKSRPRRTWFETEHDKKKARQAGKDELNGLREGLKKKTSGGKLSNKDKKKLDARAARVEGLGRVWKKGKGDAAAAEARAKARGKGKGKAKGRAQAKKFGRLRPHLQNERGLLGLVFPRAVRGWYRERLLDFQLDTLPRVKRTIQSRIYRFLVHRHRKGPRRSRILDLAARTSRQIPNRGAKPAARTPRLQGRPRMHVSDANQDPRTLSKAGKMPSLAGTTSGYAPDAADAPQDIGERGERGYRRRKLAAMAGSLYRSGQQAVTDFRDSYAQSRVRGGDDYSHESTHIPGAFPDVAIASQGNEQMVLFPSYGKQHVKREWTRPALGQQSEQSEQQRKEEWWRQEWEKHEDEKAVVDVDVRGWIYTPHVRPMTRRNRILIGLARQLSGIPAPKMAEAGNGPTGGDELKTQHQIHQEMHDQEKIEHEAAVIEKRGQEEKRVAYAGGYSEQPQDTNGMPRRMRRVSSTPSSAPSSPRLSARQPAAAGELTDAELAVANANLMARVAPFLTNPLVAMPITIFFYDETKSQSKTVLTDDAGHFNVRAALDFVPTHVRVLANEKLSATQEVQITEPAGISLISDIDDTIKRSNISGGAREIFRNTFVRELGDLCVEGVREWYTTMHRLGVSLHYCSNSPWQLFPVLASYFKIAGLPPGSLHLKQYSGMLQGIFEPVAERKKSTLNRLMRDFPGRRFLLVGDSGEADLEVYTDLALANPGRVLAIFIRDVTTPDTAGYFDPSTNLSHRRMSSLTLDEGRTGHAKLASRHNSAPETTMHDKAPTGPATGTLIDFSEEPEEARLDDSAALAQLQQQGGAARRTSAADLLAGGSSSAGIARKPPPPRPAKPAALRSPPTQGDMSSRAPSQQADIPPPPKPKRAPGPAGTTTGLQPLTTIFSGDERSSSGGQESGMPVPAPAPPLPRRRSGLKSMSPRLFGRGSVSSSMSNADVDFEPLPPSAAGPPPPPPAATYHHRGKSGSRSGSTTPSGSPTLGAQGGAGGGVVNKKLELWRRRLARAHEQLDSQGVALYTWRTGHDVVAEAVGLVEQAGEDMQRNRH